MNYQDDVNAQLQCEDDIEAASEEDDNTDPVNVDSSEKVQTAVQKVSHFTYCSAHF